MAVYTVLYTQYIVHLADRSLERSQHEKTIFIIPGRHVSVSGAGRSVSSAGALLGFKVTLEVKNGPPTKNNSGVAIAN